MTPEQVAYALPIAITAIGFCFTTLVTGGTAFFVWYKERQAGRDKEVVISSAYTREQKRSNQIFDEASEKTAQQQLILSFSDLVKQSIAAGNGQVSKLIELVSDNAASVASRLERIEASQNQIVIFLRGPGQSRGEIDAALIVKDAIKRSEAIVDAADMTIQAERDAKSEVKSD